MNGLQASRQEAQALAQADGGAAILVVCPPATLLADVARDLEGGGVRVGGQTCHEQTSGAFTGEVSAPMLADAGAHYVIVGHSERRATGETDADVRAKAEAGQAAGLTPIVCVGETLAEREAGQADQRITAQVAASLPHGGTGPIIIAYEPIWAIGTGVTATPTDIAAMHRVVRNAVGSVRQDAEPSVLYGGSVKPQNAGEILATDGVDGVLVGGASLTAESFLAIAAAAPASR